MEKLFLKTLNGVWPMVFIFTIILVSTRLVYIICNKKELIIHKEITTLFFIIYLLLLYYVVTFQDNNYGTSNLIPFREIFRYPLTSKLFFKNIIGNIFLFIPFGFFISLYINPKTLFPTFFLSLLISGSIEYVQGLIGRTVDIDDVILNVAGGLIGYMIFYIFKKISYKLPKIFKNQIFLDVLSLLFILFIIYMVIRFELWRIIL